MRKRINTPGPPGAGPGGQDWLDLDSLAEVEISSEDAAHPIESALLPGRGSGWRAAGPGEQMIRVLFTTPQRIHRIHLRFEEPTVERTQQYVLRWSPGDGQPSREIVRQQWNFSPRGATSQVEDHHVDLPAVAAIELTIIPDISGRDAVASLAALRVA
jgi:hypothetical protein